MTWEEKNSNSLKICKPEDDFCKEVCGPTSCKTKEQKVLQSRQLTGC